MRRDDFTMALDLGNELIIDNFAGGGGTSTGLEQAFGRPVDIAINHDPEALAMHAANHPHTKHLCESVWDVDPIKVTGNQPVGLVWLSPDCKHFSKAKGGKPVEKKIRGLAWVTLRWAAKCKPRVIMLENVEEFKTWGPLKMVMVDGVEVWMPDPTKKGKTFDSFIRQLKGHGYDVQYRELRGCDHDTPTIRKRLFLVARRDGIPITWPEPTHGAPDSIGVKAGKLLPYRTAAECIDWSLPCPSIFDRKKPLAEATLRRIAKGIMRYVVDAADPFIVGQGGPKYSGKPVSANQPIGTLTADNHRAIVMPSIVPVTHQGGNRTESIDEPFRTITGAHRGEKALATATLEPIPTWEEWISKTKDYGGTREEYDRMYLSTEEYTRIYYPEDPGLTAATMVQVGYGERQAKYHCDVCGLEFADKHATDAGRSAPVECPECYEEQKLRVLRAAQEPRALDIKKPLGTIAGGASKHAVVEAELAPFVLTNTTGHPGASVDAPVPTVTSAGNQALTAAYLSPYYSDKRPSDVRGQTPDEPVKTVTTENRHALVSALLAGVGGRAGQSRPRGADEPAATITSKADSAVVTAVLVDAAHGETSPTGVKRWGSGSQNIETPMGTVLATGNKAVATAFLAKHYTGVVGSDLDDPLGTVTSSDHHSLVTALLTEHANASGQRNMPVDQPLRTICAQVKGGHFGLVSAHVTKFRSGAVGSPLDEPLHTVTAGGKQARPGTGNAMGIVTAHIQRDMGQSIGHAVDAPLGTVTAGGGGKSALVTAHIESLYGQKGNEARGSDASEPLKTVTASSRHALMTSNLVKLRGTSTASGTDEPLGTVSAGGQHHAEVRAFLLSYYGTDQDPKIDGPLATVTSKDRFGLVTIQGQDYQIVDIGLRMLAPGELFRAQGFPETYLYESVPDWEKLFVDGEQVADVNSIPWRPLTKSAQVRMCGNSVCPPMAKALIMANFSHERQIASAA